MKKTDKFLLAEVWALAEKMAEYLTNFSAVMSVQVVGDIRRRMETASRIELLLGTAMADSMKDIVSAMPGVESCTNLSSQQISARLNTGMALLIIMVPPEDFHGALHYYTGSAKYMEAIAAFAGSRGMTVDEQGIKQTDGKTIKIDSEKNFFVSLGLQYIEPELRESADIIDTAARYALPKLIAADDLKGVLHVHTLYSDGREGLCDMAEAAQLNGWKYLGITDHSRTAHYAGGLQIGAIIEQRKAIERYNEANPNFVILAGIESDILVDGSLDYPDDILASFDFVIASVHSHFKQTEAEKTKRMVKAMENPFVTMLGHPTGRMLLTRDAYSIDMPTVLQAAADTGTLIEINASPHRLDLDWRWHQEAKNKGILLSINPDAHGREQLKAVMYGLAMARKGGLTPADIVNTRPYGELSKMLRCKRNI